MEKNHVKLQLQRQIHGTTAETIQETERLVLLHWENHRIGVWQKGDNNDKQ
jgi:hypothetical protein